MLCEEVIASKHSRNYWQLKIFFCSLLECKHLWKKKKRSNIFIVFLVADWKFPSTSYCKCLVFYLLSLCVTTTSYKTWHAVNGEKTVPVPNIWETEVSASQFGLSSRISITWKPDRCKLASKIPYITKVHLYDVINIVNISIHLFQGLGMPYIMKRSRSGCLSSDLLQLFLILKIVEVLKHLLFLMVTQEHL